MEPSLDFSRYVVGSLEEWTSVTIGVNPPKTAKERFEHFHNALAASSRTKFETLRRALKNAESIRRLGPEETKRRMGFDISEEMLQRIVSELETGFLETIASDRKKLREYTKFTKAYIEKPHKFQRAHPFDTQKARRWMLKRVFDYGWSAERFGWFDHRVNDHRHAAHKAESIGEKYQWIAYRELLARLADNFYCRKHPTANEPYVIWKGDWEIGRGSTRDIDPAVAIRRTCANGMFHSKTWWVPVSYTAWHDAPKGVEWLKLTDDLPAIQSTLSVQQPELGSRWYVLDAIVTWREPPRPGTDGPDFPQRELYYVINSYLVRKGDAASFFNWAKRQRVRDCDTPEPLDLYGISLGELYWSPRVRALELDGAVGWQQSKFTRLPNQVLTTSVHYAHEGRGYDCSVDENLGIRVPAPEIGRQLGLRFSKVEGRFVDAGGSLVAWDPSVHEEGFGALLIAAEPLNRYLSENGLDLFWTIRGEKQMVGGMTLPKDFGWLEINGVYKLTRKGPVGQTRAIYQSPSRVSEAPSGSKVPR